MRTVIANYNAIQYVLYSTILYNEQCEYFYRCGR